MSEYIFDQVYGSEARREKILSSNSFLYYRQIMRIKNKHIKNPQLYSHVFETPSGTLVQQSPHSYRSKPAYSPQFLSTLDRNNYAIQKLNPHAFKIIKRKQKPSSIKHNQHNDLTIKNDSINSQKKPLANRILMSSQRKVASRTISRDQHELREYLNRSEHARSQTKQRQKYLCLTISSDKKIATPTTVNKTQRSISPFSTIRHSGLSFIKP